jgi:EAL domain-containing protein (putative c-di-GMP-specific phosphodiesterase class I)
VREPSVLDSILDPGGLTVLFQPIVELNGPAPRVHALEALVRGPQGSNLESADVLFEYVRRRHEEMVVDRACVRAIFSAAVRLPEAWGLNLNVHASTLSRDLEFLPFLGDAAESHGIELSRLTVEIVEHAPPWDGPSFLAALDGLRHIGVQIALDDVGLGQSNYRMILDSKPDYFKIDRYFVKGAHADFYRQAVLDSVCRLAQKFGARMVAEGVEDAIDLATLRSLGIGLVQGNLFSAPRPLALLAPALELQAEPGVGAVWQ